jgi:hypothetical protein
MDAPHLSRPHIPHLEIATLLSRITEVMGNIDQPLGPLLTTIKEEIFERAFKEAGKIGGRGRVGRARCHC